VLLNQNYLLFFSMLFCVKIVSNAHPNSLTSETTCGEGISPNISFSSSRFLSKNIYLYPSNEFMPKLQQ